VRRSRPSARKSIRALLLLGLGIAAGCAPVPYDFSPSDDDGGQPGTGGLACENLVPEVVQCVSPADHPDGCVGGAEAATATIGETLGCTPAGQALAVIENPGPGSAPQMDLYAWAWEGGDGMALSGGPTIALFRDTCGEELFGPDNQCGYEPWLFRSGVATADGFSLHVQTNEPSAAGIGFQLMEPGGWFPSPPGPDVAMICSATPGGYVDDALIYPNPLEAAAVPIVLFDRAPAVGHQPRICQGASLGWRESVFLLRNPLDQDAHVTGIGLSNPSWDGAWVPFNFAVFRCGEDDEVGPGQAAAAQSCEQESVAGVKAVDLPIVMWDGTAATEYLLVLQVPPWVALRAEMSLFLD
jgi:hypothetical protein